MGAGMEPHFEKVVIIGVGLLGASLGLGLKSRGRAAQVVGVGRRQASLDKALEVGAVDAVSFNPAESAVGADLIVAATPAALVVDTLDAIRPSCSPETIVTDVASTKQAICAHARKSWPAPSRFVGSHPMAGSEKFGPEHGRPDFYAGSVCLVEKAPHLHAESRAKIVALWQMLGASTVDIDPETHDALLARTSHLPHVLAAIAELADKKGDVRKLIGNGYRDMTRIAASRPEVWRDISMTNRDALLDSIDEFKDYLDTFAAALTANDEAAVQAFFERANAAHARTTGA